MGATIAAITGQLADVLYAAEALPQAWRDMLTWGDRTEAMAEAQVETPNAERY